MRIQTVHSIAACLSFLFIISGCIHNTHSDETPNDILLKIIEQETLNNAVTGKIGRTHREVCVQRELSCREAILLYGDKCNLYTGRNSWIIEDPGIMSLQPEDGSGYHEDDPVNEN